MLTALALLLAACPLPAPAQAAPVAPPAGAQQAPGAATPGRLGSEWRLVDGIWQIVDHEVITWSQLALEVRSRTKGIAINNDEERVRIQRQIQQFLIERLLWSQAGDDMGIERERVETSIDQLIRDQREQLGLVEMSEQLASNNYDKRDEHDLVRKELMLGLWRDSVLGRQPGALGRYVEDTYVRPGKLYGMFLNDPSAVSEPEQVRIQVLVIHAAASGGIEPAREFTASLREQLLGGADFDRLVEENGARYRPNGRSDLIPADELAQVEWRDFLAERPDVGSLSDVLEYNENGEQIGFQIVKLLERVDPPPPPPFSDPDLQRSLTEAARKLRENVSLKLANRRLYESSYFEPPLAR